MTLVVAAFPDMAAGARALTALRSEFRAELHTREAPDLPADEGEEKAGDLIARAAVAAALAGAALSLLVQYWSASVAYPMSVGGRTPPTLFSYVPAAVAVGMFWSALAAFVAFLWSCGLPRLHHPLFDARGQGAVARGGSVVTVEAENDGQVARACAALRAHGARSIELVDR